MARHLDNFPTYDPIIKDSVYLSDVWANFMATFIESLQEYLSAFGDFIPQLTIEERNSIQTPVEGQIIYVSNSNAPTLPRTAQLQIWQVVAGIGQWTVIV
jgi:hypothetical protein